MLPQATRLQTIVQSARTRLFGYALRRPETPLLLIGGTALTVLSLTRILPFAFWWVWPVLSLIGVIVIVLAATTAQSYVRPAAAAMFYEQFSADKLKLPDLRRGVSQMLDRHRSIFHAIVMRPSAPLGPVAAHMDSWAAGIYELAESLDTFVNDEVVLDRVDQLLAPTFDASATAHQLRAPLALSRLDTQGAALNDEDRLMLTRMRTVISEANETLSRSFAMMDELNVKIRARSGLTIDRDFAENTRGLIASQCIQLSQSSALVRDLFRECLQADAATVRVLND
jgi:hypothetical protein